MARVYRTEDTSDLVYWAVGLLLLGMWCVKDGWYPSKKVMDKHPRSIELSFDQAGMVSQVMVRPGSEVGESMKVAEMVSDEIKRRFLAADAEVIMKEREYREATGERSATNETKDAKRTLEATGRVAERKRVYDDAFAKREAIRKELDGSVLRSTGNGIVSEVRAKVNGEVKAGEPVIVLASRDSFYLFNRSLAIICLLISSVCFIRFFAFRRKRA